MADTTYVEGLRELIRTLEKAGVEASDMKEVFTAIGDMVASDSRKIVPTQSGRLEATIKPTKTKNKAAVRVGGARAKYAGVIEYGWPKRGIKARSYIRRAIDSDQARAVEMMEQGLNDIINKLGLDPQAPDTTH